MLSSDNSWVLGEISKHMALGTPTPSKKQQKLQQHKDKT